MKVYIGTDHRGFRLKNQLREYLEGRKGLNVVDMGAHDIDEDDDYPDISRALGIAVRDDEEHGSLGILLCGSGVGATVAVNKIRGIRATLVPDAWTAQAARNDDDVNVMVFAADRTTLEDAKKISRVFLQASFSQAKRHRRRVGKVNTLDQERP